VCVCAIAMPVGWSLKYSNSDCQPASGWFASTDAHAGRGWSPAKCSTYCAGKGYAYAIVPTDKNCKCSSATQCTSVSSRTTWNIYSSV